MLQPLREFTSFWVPTSFGESIPNCQTYIFQSFSSFLSEKKRKSAKKKKNHLKMAKKVFWPAFGCASIQKLVNLHNIQHKTNNHLKILVKPIKTIFRSLKVDGLEGCGLKSAVVQMEKTVFLGSRLHPVQQVAVNLPQIPKLSFSSPQTLLAKPGMTSAWLMDTASLLTLFLELRYIKTWCS